MSDEGLVNYEALSEDREALDDYLAWLAVAPDPPLEGEAALARAVNAYNAYVLVGVLENWPLESVRDVQVGLYALAGSGFFKGLRFTWDGEIIDLHDFENDTIRGFEDPRIHGAINCASAGCPPLRRGLYQGHNLDAELDDAMARFIRERSRIDDDQAVFSEIFSWFESDFLEWGEAETLCHYVAGFDSTYEALAEEGCPHRFESYDWSLNNTDELDPQEATTEQLGWEWPPTPGDCPPFTRRSDDLCVQDSPFGTLPEQNYELAEHLNALGGRFACEQGVCAPPDPAYTSCGVLSTSRCAELQAQQRSWQKIGERCSGQGVECILLDPTR